MASTFSAFVVLYERRCCRGFSRTGCTSSTTWDVLCSVKRLQYEFGKHPTLVTLRLRAQRRKHMAFPSSTGSTSCVNLHLGATRNRCSSGPLPHFWSIPNPLNGEGPRHRSTASSHPGETSFQPQSSDLPWAPRSCRSSPSTSDDGSRLRGFGLHEGRTWKAPTFAIPSPCGRIPCLCSPGLNHGWYVVAWNASHFPSKACFKSCRQRQITTWE